MKFPRVMLLVCKEESLLSIHAGLGACFACFLGLRGPVLVNEDCSGLVLFMGSDRGGEADACLRAEFAESQGAGNAPGGLGPCPPLRQLAFLDRVGDGC